ncbi:type II CAAX endopeptidase family protein [Virgibacillus sp. LDC-1]|uniref:CPBP family intramembrane glutamic endopeptidase n=1 Tax=Virgibacillus sp. LDC-1 TaxID=3039856 RepID=UPI0024DE4A4C|nr:type II CAAX endopeptidase family protein [Virgibacillus sp. LDC-1]
MFEEMKIHTFLIAGVLLTFALSILALFTSETTFLLLFSYSILGFFPIIWVGMQLKKQQKRFTDIMTFHSMKDVFPMLIYITIVLFFFSLGAFWLMNYGLSFIFPSVVDYFLQEIDIFPNETVPFVLTALYISILGPIAEEFIFRGILFKRLSAKYNLIVGIIVANVLFGILHTDIIGAFMFGFVLSLIYQKTGNLLLPIMVHILNNGFITVLALIDPPIPAFVDYRTIEEVHATMLPNLMMLLIATSLLISFIRKNKAVLTNH